MTPQLKPSASWRVRFLLCVMTACAWSGARAEVRALVWASDYSTAHNHDLELGNTLVDARAVSDMLRKLGVKDVRVIENASAETWDSEIQGLADRLAPDDVALLYYAGHAVQVAGRNYFLAADGSTLISSEDVLSTIMGKGRGAVFLIDACRDNPFRNQAASEKKQLKIGGVGTNGGVTKGAVDKTKSRSMGTMSVAELAKSSAGLSQMGNLRGKNTIVLFSTDPGNVALDGEPGGGSPFANAVVNELSKRQSLDSAIRKITAAVDKQTNSKQSPWRQGDLSFPLFLAGQPRFPVP
jgi:uncharacterized caspase-like protein